MQRPPSPVQSLAITVRGVVQGVGFRPFVVRRARALGLAGRVSNRGGTVAIEVEGPPHVLERFIRILAEEPPASSRVVAVESRPIAPLGFAGFGVAESGAGEHSAALPPDLAPCDECLREIRDPSSRRARHPFTSCTACGPRYSIVRELPYDRARTSMVAFPLCASCAREYGSVDDRRFHAETQACPACGPRLSFKGPDGGAIAGDPILLARDLVHRGGVLALEGVGGFQLACLATDEAAVRALRERKRRPGKPLALCVASLDDARRWVELVPGAEEALASPARPIVLLPLPRAGEGRGGGIAPSVAPGLRELGVMLPASPLHALLLEGEPAPWVLTSGNVHGQPLVIDDAVALATLPADGFLHHDRAIVARADDSVVRVHRGRARVLRRARGYVPRSIALPVRGPDLVALGGDLAATVCLVRDGLATVSPHLGDLSNVEVEASLRDALAHLQRLLDVKPRAVACDRHPDYVSARIARELGGVLVPVQHHHAHAAACLAEHGRAGPALAIVLDGTGHGDDGTTWGGELLRVDLRDAGRLGRLRPVAVPGGDRATRETWRSALAHLADAGLEAALDGVAPEKIAVVRAMLARRVNAPLASSTGRLFDAVSAILGVRTETTYEAQAAIELEALAAPNEHEPYPCALDETGTLLEIDTRALVRAVVRDREAGVGRDVIAARFHAGLAAAFVAAVVRARERTGLSLVALSGGAFANARLLALVEDELETRGFEVLVPREFPPGDGGLSLGQAAVASARLAV